jgi:two-component system OmpR family sensor kinase
MSLVTEVHEPDQIGSEPPDADVPPARPGRLRRARHAVRQRLSGPWSLRSRLLAAVVSLSLVAIVVVSAATYFALGSYLRDRLDRQLMQSGIGVNRNLSDTLTGSSAPRPLLGEQDTAITFYNLNGTLRYSYNSIRLPLKTMSNSSPRILTVTASNGHRYRAVVAEAVIQDGSPSGTPIGTVVYGLPISQVDNVLHRLLLLELAVGGGAIVLLFLGGTALVRVGLRPLDKMGETAEKIAEGDLSQRVPTTSPRTEVGRLGNSLNTMLTTIEDEIDQRTASEERLRRFISDASHELRTPLTSIRGYAELFRRGAVDRPEDLAMAMRRIESESGRMGGLVEDLLLLARLDERRPLEKSRVDLAELARDAAHDAGVLAPDRDATVTAEGNAVVLGDDGRLRQVLANLTRNVLAHTPAGAPFGIRVRGEADVVRVEVWDRGPGLDAEAQAKVFDRFWRADPSRVRDSAYSGAGLGLSIVAALVASHDGTVVASQTSGGGATFTVVLPRGVADA